MISKSKIAGLCLGIAVTLTSISTVSAVGHPGFDINNKASEMKLEEIAKKKRNNR